MTSLPHHCWVGVLRFARALIPLQILKNRRKKINNKNNKPTKKLKNNYSSLSPPVNMLSGCLRIFCNSNCNTHIYDSSSATNRLIYLYIYSVAWNTYQPVLISVLCSIAPGPLAISSTKYYIFSLFQNLSHLLDRSLLCGPRALSVGCCRRYNGRRQTC